MRLDFKKYVSNWPAEQQSLSSNVTPTTTVENNETDKSNENLPKKVNQIRRTTFNNVDALPVVKSVESLATTNSGTSKGTSTRKRKNDTNNDTNAKKARK